MKVGDGRRVKVLGRGTAVLWANGKIFHLTGCLYIPSLLRSLISVPTAISRGLSFHMNATHCDIIHDSSGETLLSIPFDFDEKFYVLRTDYHSGSSM
jgi:hypothetical protein